MSTISFNNFKPFGKNIQTFPKKPITLIYGPNSAGKSSLIHLMAYINYIRTQKLFDAYEINKGETISLGGFRNYVHKKNVNNDIMIKIPLKLYDDPERYSVKFIIGFSKTKNQVFLKKIAYYMNEEKVFSIDSTGLMKVYLITRYMKRWIEKIKKNGMWSNQEIECALDLGSDRIINFPSTTKIEKFKDFRYEFYGSGHDEHDADKLSSRLTYWNKSCENEKLSIERIIDLHKENKKHMFDGNRDILHFLSDSNNENSEAIYNIKPYYLYLKNGHKFRKDRILSLKLILVHFAMSLAIKLNGSIFSTSSRFHYIGPLRFYPERGSDFNNDYHMKTNDSKDFWSLLKGKFALRLGLNRLLEQLEIPYALQVRKLYDLTSLSERGRQDGFSMEEIEKEAYFIDELMFMDRKNNTFVHNREIGLGITQLIPVLGNSIAMENTTIAIEQPELHLHPKLQSEIADVFIDSMKNRNNSFVIESHSEHLLLRMMKRMRQTSEGELEDESLKLTPDDVALLYVDTDGENTFILELELDEDGTLLDQWPGGFFEEGFNERFL